MTTSLRRSDVLTTEVMAVPRQRAMGDGNHQQKPMGEGPLSENVSASGQRGAVRGSTLLAAVQAVWRVLCTLGLLLAVAFREAAFALGSAASSLQGLPATHADGDLAALERMEQDSDESERSEAIEPEEPLDVAGSGPAEDAEQEAAPGLGRVADEEIADNVVVRRLRSLVREADVLRASVCEVRKAHHEVRFSVQIGFDFPCVALLGSALRVARACDDLEKLVPLEFDQCFDKFFALHFTMRELSDLPQDVELVDASLDDEWLDLGASEHQFDGQINDEHRAHSGILGSPQMVLRRRLQRILPDHEHLHIFMDTNSLTTWGQNSPRIDIVGLLPDAWDMAIQAVLKCEAGGIYLSRQYDALFCCQDDEWRTKLEEQIHSSLGHSTGGSLTNIGSCFGCQGADIVGLEDMSANVLAVLQDQRTPGWHKLEWTPHGTGAVPHLTY